MIVNSWADPLAGGEGAVLLANAERVGIWEAGQEPIMMITERGSGFELYLHPAYKLILDGTDDYGRAIYFIRPRSKEEFLQDIASDVTDSLE